MNRDLRDAIELAEKEGLSFVDVRPGGKHIHVRFRRPCGAVLVTHLNGGAKTLSRSPFNKLNLRAEFRRFARGAFYGLIVEEVQHV